MKRFQKCLKCVLIFTFCGLLVFAKDTPSASASISVSENVSSDSVPEKTTLSSENVISELEPSGDFVDTKQENVESFKQVFVEATSQNSGVANDITTGGGQPVVLTLSDVATAELQQRAILPSQNPNENSQTNQTATNRSEPIKQTEKIHTPSVKENLTEEEIPSFSEWAQKQLEEDEKNKEPLNVSTQNQNVNGKQTKLRWKNYASLDCGAKVVASNPEAVSPSAILSPSRDEYKLNTCTSRIWFIVELCEAIQAKKIDFANFELFSSSPKDFVVSVSDRFPTREWSNVGHFTAKDERDIQSFDLQPHLFGKYIKVEVKSHYGSEHYCPISLFRVYGTSEFEVLQKEDPVHANRLEDDDDDDETLEQNGDASKNLFSSATDAVISMVKKAAEVLGNKGNYSNQTEIINNTKQVSVPLVRVCTSPSHLIVCDNCSDPLFGQIYELLSCHDSEIRNLIGLPLIAKVITGSHICQKFGLKFCQIPETYKQARYVETLLPERLLGAMCNMVAVFQSKVVLNVSSQYSNDTTVTDDDKLINIETSEPHIIPIETTKKESEVTDALSLEITDPVTKSTCSTDVTYTSQIKPTKTLTSELDIRESVTETTSVITEDVVTTQEEVKANQTEKIEVIPTEIETEHVPEVTTESVETLEEQLEHLMEFNGDQHLPSTQTTASTTPQAQKESVFLRLSNRIKALERNMSLSGQYLEELSKRYKKQVEEIQKLLDKTILTNNEESKKKDERNKQLEERLNTLTVTVAALIAEKKSWSSTVYCIIVSSLVTLFIVTFCYRIPEPVASRRIDSKRRKSVDLIRPPPPPPKKKRRPSDQALKIVRSSMETSDSFRRKKKKKQVLKRSNSIGTLHEEKKTAVWNRQESVSVDWVEGKHLEEVPFVLEESEHSTLEPVALADGGKIVAPNFITTALNSRALRVNGETTKTLNINGNISCEEGTPKKERKGLKKYLKKVF